MVARLESLFLNSLRFSRQDTYLGLSLFLPLFLFEFTQLVVLSAGTAEARLALFKGACGLSRVRVLESFLRVNFANYFSAEMGREPVELFWKKGT